MKGFVLRALAWTLAMLILRYWAAPWFAPMMSVASGYLMHFFFPDWVNGSGWNGAALYLFTDLPLQAVGEIRHARFKAYASMTTLGIGLPFLIALLFASKAQSVVKKIFIGVLILVPFQLWSICFVWLSQVVFERGPQTLQELGLSVSESSLIALGVHIGDTVFPVLIPVLIWFFLERRFVEDIFVHTNNTQKQ